MKKAARGPLEKFNAVITEHCTNPWNGECSETNIELYILYRGDRLPICRSCWNEIAEKDVEWR